MVPAVKNKNEKKLIVELNDDQIKELHAWLLRKGVALPNLGQRFADATELARLLKTMYPRRVELHNYSSCSSTAAKVCNWNALSFKVLTKLNIKLSKSTIDELARGVNAAVEALLFKIMTLEKTNNQNAMKQNSLELRTVGREKQTRDQHFESTYKQSKTAHFSENSAAFLASIYKNDPPADEQKIIAELCKELHIDAPKGY